MAVRQRVSVIQQMPLGDVSDSQHQEQRRRGVIDLFILTPSLDRSIASISLLASPEEEERSLWRGIPPPPKKQPISLELMLLTSGEILPRRRQETFLSLLLLLRSTHQSLADDRKWVVKM